jgi:hypothetical protein
LGQVMRRGHSRMAHIEFFETVDECLRRSKHGIL